VFVLTRGGEEGYGIRELITLGALDDVVKNKNGAIVAALEDKNVLILGLLVVENLVDSEVHGLTRPHFRLLGEPAIWIRLGLVRIHVNRSTKKQSLDTSDRPETVQ
jgi:hypothetical protein